MKNGFTRQAEDFLRTAADVRMPESMQAMAEDSLTKSREVYTKMSAAALDTQKALTDVAGVASEGARTLGEKVLSNVNANTHAAFDAAEAIARSKTLPEALQLQTKFMQSQMATAGVQAREFYELSAKVAQQTFETMNAAATRAFNASKPNG